MVFIANAIFIPKRKYIPANSITGCTQHHRWYFYSSTGDDIDEAPMRGRNSICHTSSLVCREGGKPKKGTGSQYLHTVLLRVNILTLCMPAHYGWSFNGCLENITSRVLLQIIAIITKLRNYKSALENWIKNWEANMTIRFYVLVRCSETRLDYLYVNSIIASLFQSILSAKRKSYPRFGDH